MRSFDDTNMRQERWRADKFTAFREIFDEFNKFCAKNMFPDIYIAIDETLYHSGHTTKVNQLNTV